MIQRTLLINDLDTLSDVCGQADSNLKLLEYSFGVQITVRDQELRVAGSEPNAQNAVKALELLIEMRKRGDTVDELGVKYVISMVDEGKAGELSKLGKDCVCITARGKPIKAKTLGQRKYIDSIKSNIVNIGYGPAGTGKTYLAVAMAVTAFRSKEINRIVLTRPAVEAGENLGFLPGDLQAKVDPYLRPLYDALFEMFGADTVAKLFEKNVLEIAPLAYMRGRTLDDSFIILDEAQNTTSEQMKMFLTRLGANSKAVITGDITQIDLPYGKKSGLKEVLNILENIDGIGISELTAHDIVRHPLVQKIINAYEKHEKRRSSAAKPDSKPKHPAEKKR